MSLRLDSLIVSLVDDMDNSKSLIPRSPEISKTGGSLFKLPTKITGAIIWSGKYPENRKVIFYLNHNQVLDTLLCSANIAFISHIFSLSKVAQNWSLCSTNCSMKFLKILANSQNT